MINLDKYLIDITSWQIIQNGENAARIASPFSFGDDGSCISFSIFLTDKNHFVLTDDADSAMQAAMFGIKLNKDKINSLNATTGVDFAKFAENGEIQASGTIDQLQFALFDATKLALSMSFRMSRWLPKFNAMRFKTLVEKSLLKTIPKENIIKDIVVKGISGHDIKFPFAVKTDESLTYIATIPLNDDQMNWEIVYQTHGRFSDVKRVDDINKRLTIIEDGSNAKDFGSASTLLADVTSIRTLQTTKNWASALLS